MNPVVFHIASGDSFFTGVALLLASFGLAQSSRRVLNRLTAVTFIIGVVAMAVFATAIPYWYLRGSQFGDRCLDGITLHHELAEMGRDCGLCCVDCSCAGGAALALYA